VGSVTSLANAGTYSGSMVTHCRAVSQFPNCIGAIDGKHVRIICPKLSGSLFYNYKHYSSTVLLALVDVQYCFTAIDVGSYGREGDCHNFNGSVLGTRMANDL
jgi:hypothetical protein